MNSGASDCKEGNVDRQRRGLDFFLEAIAMAGQITDEDAGSEGDK